jgi:dynein heavy chain
MHKLLFSTLLTHRILNGSNQINNNEWRYLLAGPSGEVTIPENPTKWIQDNSWPDFYRNIHGMINLHVF